MRWLPLAALVLAQIGYPLVTGGTRTLLVAVTVVLGFAWSAGHALVSRGSRVAIALVAVTTGGGLLVEAVGQATGWPFGSYDYSDAFGWKLLGVPWVIPLAWTWMAWPAWLVAGALTRHLVARIGLAALGLAAWDLFLDPQMVAEGYWRWASSDHAALPGVPEVPVSNYLGWLVVAAVMMALLAGTAGSRGRAVDRHDDTPMLVLYLWTYASCVLAHAVFLGLPASAVWGGLGMGLVAVPLAVQLSRPLVVRLARA
ncbi:MAG TPA: carotenoid biosynthesis protein [Micromonosporaceae bacterium]